MTQSPTRSLAATAEGATGKPRLLIVDDEAGPRESLRIVFKDRYECSVATSGREGVAHAKNNPVDVAILDIKMPDISGVEVLRELKTLDPTIECIMLTGYETIETARAAVRYGAADYLSKPFDVFAIRELIDKCLARRRARQASEQTLKSLQRMNEELAHELAQSSRAVTASMLSAGVVHEINNPLAIIQGYTQLLERDLLNLVSADPQAAQNLQQRMAVIQREVDRCKDIAKRFLRFSRSAKQTEEIVDVRTLLDDAAALVKAHPANKGVEITVQMAEPSLPLKVHPGEVLQVLINLAVNGLQAMGGMGRLTLGAAKATSLPANPPFRSETFDPNRPMIRLSIGDTGCGISAEQQQKIFQPYFTTKEQGTGLGLAIVSELVGRYGGVIDLQTAIGKGSTFSVYLPLAG